MATESEGGKSMTSSQGFPKYTADFKWPMYKSLVENYFAAQGVKDDNLQKQLFFAYLPIEIMRSVSTLMCSEDLSTLTMAQLFGRLSQYFGRRMTACSHMALFYGRTREVDEDIVHFAMALEVLAEGCNFGIELDLQLRNCFLAGLNHERLQNILNDCAGQGEKFRDFVQRALALNGSIGKDGRGGGDIVNPVTVQSQEPIRVSFCQFVNVGCTYLGTTEGMKAHLLSSCAEHLLMSKNACYTGFQELKQEINGIQKNVKALKWPEYHWCITGFAAHVKAAEGQPKYRISSEVFSTRHNGSSCYQMSASVVLYGSKAPEKVCISVRLEPGVFDSILPWPFKKNVTLVLHEQSKVHKLARFEDDMPCLAREKPDQDADSESRWSNHAFTKWVKMELLERCIKDDKLFISIIVH